jgi:hypothetical protein
MRVEDEAEQHAERDEPEAQYVEVALLKADRAPSATGSAATRGTLASGRGTLASRRAAGRALADHRHCLAHSTPGSVCLPDREPVAAGDQRELNFGPIAASLP